MTFWSGAGVGADVTPNAREGLPVSTTSTITARAPFPVGAGTAGQGQAGALVQALVWSAAVEFVLLRTFLRLGPMLPVSEPLLAVYHALQVAGVAALNLALLSAVGLVALLLWQQLIMSRVHRYAPTTVVERALCLGAGPTGRLALILIVCAQGLALYYALAQAAAGWGMALPGQGSAFLAAEVLAVAAALALPWSYRPPRTRWRRRHLALGSVLGLVFLAALMARPWTVTTFGMWTVGFTLFLPGAVYAAALASAAATAWALCGAGDGGRAAGDPLAGAGLLLVAMAGLKLDSTYTAALALAGTLLLVESTSARPGGWRHVRRS